MNTREEWDDALIQGQVTREAWRTGLAALVAATASVNDAADKLAAMVDPSAATRDLGDLTEKNAARAVLYAEWESLQEAFTVVNNAVRDGDRSRAAEAKTLKKQRDEAYARLQAAPKPYEEEIES